MKYFSTIGFLALSIPCLGQTPNVTQLTISEETDGANVFSIRVEAAGLSDTEQSNVTGTVDAVLNVDPANATTSEFTITGANLQGSDTTFSFSIIFSTINLSLQDLGATLVTTSPPGLVDSQTGIFDASQHAITLNSGLITGTGIASSVNRDLSEEDTSQQLSGEGVISLTPSGEGFDVLVEAPINISNDFVIEGAGLGGSNINATVSITGNIRARGFVTAPVVDPYLAWAALNGVENVPSTDFTLSSVINNQLVFALGFDAANAPQQIWQENQNGFSLMLSNEPLREPVRIEFSTSLNSWDLAPQTQITSGENLLPAGFSGPVAVARTGLTGFYRLASSSNN